MKTAHIALLSAIGLSTVAIAQTTPQTTPDNNLSTMDNSVTTAPAPGEVQDDSQTDSATEPMTPDTTTTTTPDTTTTTTPDATTPPQR